MIQLTITMEIPGGKEPILIGGVAIHEGMTVRQIQDAMRYASGLVENRLIQENLLGVLRTPTAPLIPDDIA